MAREFPKTATTTSPSGLRCVPPLNVEWLFRDDARARIAAFMAVGILLRKKRNLLKIAWPREEFKHIGGIGGSGVA